MVFSSFLVAMARKKKPSTPKPTSSSSSRDLGPQNASEISSVSGGSAAQQSLVRMVTPQPPPASETVVKPSQQALDAIRASSRAIVERIHSRSNETVTRVSPAPAVASVSVPSVGGIPDPPVVSSDSQVPVDTPQAEGSGKESWSALFKGNFTDKGMKLGFVAPKVVDGRTVAPLDPIDLANGSIKWNSALILYVIGFKPTLTALTKYIAEHWNFIAKPEIFLHDDGSFLVRCGSEVDRDAVLSSGPHMFMNRPTAVKPWSPGFDFHAGVLFCELFRCGLG